MTITYEKISDVFGLDPSDPLILSGKGEEMKIQCLPKLDVTHPLHRFIPEIDTNYVFPVEELVSVIVALDDRFCKPALIWGFHGSGKTTLAEQACARQNRPAITVQHDVGTEASDVVGNWVLKGKETIFEYGPLARAMRDGLVYIADEYDFALPNVLSIYQGVLNGGALFIKNAPEEMAIVKPHPNFRFIATGNTNGAGDEIGLYQGTQIQNAANYSRFGITIKLDYQKPEVEAQIIKAKNPHLDMTKVDTLITFANQIRTGFRERTLTNTISTRELLNIAKLSFMRASPKKGMNWEYGVSVGFSNRMPEVDRETIKNILAKNFVSK